MRLSIFLYECIYRYLYTSIYNTYIYLSVPLSSFFVFLLHPNLKAKADERPLVSESAPGFFLHVSPDHCRPLLLWKLSWLSSDRAKKLRDALGCDSALYE